MEKKKQVFQTDFANSLICMMMKKYMRFDEAIQQHSFLFWVVLSNSYE
jgi:hypothetical protein